MKKHIIHQTRLLAILILVALGSTSCSNSFLNENLETARDFSYYNTEDGIQQLAVGAYYRVFASSFATEYQFGTTSYGTDEFHVGGDDTNSQWNNYDSRFGSIIVTTRTNAQEPWDNAYIGIGLANQLIESATNIVSTNDAIKKTALGEGYTCQQRLAAGPFRAAGQQRWLRECPANRHAVGVGLSAQSAATSPRRDP